MNRLLFLGISKLLITKFEQFQYFKDLALKDYILPMIKNESVNSNYSQSITAPKEAINFLSPIKEQTSKSFGRFTFIEDRQWLLLGVVNLVCLGFIIFACSWIGI